MRVTVDDVLAGELTADKPYAGQGNAGFDGAVPVKAGSRVCVTTVDAPNTKRYTIGCRTWQVPVVPFGALGAPARSGSSVEVSGWAIDPDQPAASTPIDVGVDGKYLRTTTADLPRPDGTRHGFEMTIDATDTGAHEVCALAWNLGLGDNAYLGCRSYNRPGAITPPSLIAQPGPGRIQVGWTTDATLSRVVVARSVDGGAWTETYRAGAVTSWTDTDMRPGLRHCYRVTVGNDRPSEATADVCATALLPAPPAPADVRVTGVTDTSIALAFTDRATTETGYQLEVRGGGTIKP